MNFIETLENQLRDINNIILQQYKSIEDIGLLSGLSGISLFSFYYSKYLNQQEHSDFGSELLRICVKKINEGYSVSNYSTGIAGFAWVLNHLESEGFVDIDLDEFLSNFDKVLYDNMIYDLKNGKYDFLHFSTGYAFYFLTRYRKTNDEILKNKYKEILLEYIKYLYDISEHDKNFFKWVWNEKGDYNLSLAHGITSIIGMLTKLYEFKEFKEKVTAMLLGAIKYIENFKNKNENSLHMFPIIVYKNNVPNFEGRIAWCYGDLGIGLRFWFAAKVIGDADLRNLSLEILKNCASLVNVNHTKVIDAPICHGSFGNSLIFSRIYKETGHIIFKKASEFWIRDGINKSIHKDGFAGYKLILEPIRPDISTINFLEGISGIGLVILNYLSSHNSEWDECLMIS